MYVIYGTFALRGNIRNIQHGPFACLLCCQTTQKCRKLDTIGTARQLSKYTPKEPFPSPKPEMTIMLASRAKKFVKHEENGAWGAKKLVKHEDNGTWSAKKRVFYEPFGARSQHNCHFWLWAGKWLPVCILAKLPGGAKCM